MTSCLVLTLLLLELYGSVGGTQLTVTCDTVFGVYIDGDFTDQSQVYPQVVRRQLTSDVQVIGVHCTKINPSFGIVAAVDNGVVTDTSWRCSSSYQTGWVQPDFDDSAWDLAIEVAPYGAAPWGTTPGQEFDGAHWIWTSDSTASDAYCRKINLMWMMSVIHSELHAKLYQRYDASDVITKMSSVTYMSGNDVITEEADHAQCVFGCVETTGCVFVRMVSDLVDMDGVNLYRCQLFQ